MLAIKSNKSAYKIPVALDIKSSTKSDAEINLARSRMVLGRTVEELNTDQVVIYKSTPILNWFGRKKIKAEEALKLNVFTVPENLENIQILLVYHGNKKYSLIVPEVMGGSEKMVDGEFGKLLSSQGILLNITEILYFGFLINKN